MMPFLWSGWGGSQRSEIDLGLSARTVRLAGVPGTTRMSILRGSVKKDQERGREKVCNIMSSSNFNQIENFTFYIHNNRTKSKSGAIITSKKIKCYILRVVLHHCTTTSVISPCKSGLSMSLTIFMSDELQGFRVWSNSNSICCYPDSVDVVWVKEVEQVGCCYSDQAPHSPSGDLSQCDTVLPDVSILPFLKGSLP